MDTRARARNPRNPPPFTIRFIEYDNSIAITPADFLPSKHDVFTNFCVFNFFHGGKRGKYLADSLYLPHFLFRVLRAITTCRPMFSSKYGIITVYLVRELSLSILNRVSHVQFQLSSLSLSLFSICWFSKRRCKYVVFNISLNRKISRVESIFDRNFRFLFSVKKREIKREREKGERKSKATKTTMRYTSRLGVGSFSWKEGNKDVGNIPITVSRYVSPVESPSRWKKKIYDSWYSRVTWSLNIVHRFTRVEARVRVTHGAPRLVT